MSEQAFEGWAVLELLGHRRLAGYVREATIAGAAFLRIDVVTREEGDEATQYVSPSSVYALTPCTEEVARAVAERTWETPARQLALPAPQIIRDEDPAGLRECVCSHVHAAHDAEDERCLIRDCGCLGFDEADTSLEHHNREGLAF